MAIIFGPDTFTVGADVDIDDYPAVSPGNNYAYSRGSGTDMQVKAATDDVRPAGASSTTIVARCVNAAVPTTLGNQEVRADIRGNLTGVFTAPGLAARYSTTTRGYFTFLDFSTANEVQIFEDNGGTSLIASADRGLVEAVTYAAVFSAIGGAGSTDLSFAVGGTAAVTFNDTTAPATGQPGMVIYTGGGTPLAFIDNFVVDDLIASNTLMGQIML